MASEAERRGLRVLRLPPLVRSRHRLKDQLAALLFLAPSLIVFSVFVYYALGYNVYLSLTSWNLISATKAFVGLANYRQLFADPRFWKVVTNTFYYGTASVALSLVFGLGLALLLSRKIKGRGVFRTFIYAPSLTTVAAISLLWIWIFEPTYGLVNYGLGLVGISGPHWLTSSTWAMPALIIMNVWRTMGYNMVIFVAGLTSIPRVLYEAAEMDGARSWQAFRYITLPMLSPTTYFLLITSFISAMQVFDSVAVMTRGGPVDATKVLNYYIFEQAFSLFRAGPAAAAAIFLFVIILVLTLLQFRLSRRWVHYQ